MDDVAIPDVRGWLARQTVIVRGLAGAFVVMLGERLDAFVALVGALRAQVADRDHRIAQLERQAFGRKSERLKLPDPKREARRALRRKLTPEEREARRQEERTKSRKNRESLPVVDKLIHLPAETCCPACGGTDLHALGEGEVTEQIELVPAHLVRLRFVREKRACGCGQGIVTAPPPPQVVEGGEYGPKLHAHVVVSKCVDAMPLHRQSRAFARAGLQLSPTQLCAMFHRVAEAVEPIHKAMLARLPESRYVQADETTQPVLEPGQCRKGWMWTFLDELSIVFVYDPSRGGKVAARVLGVSEGVLTVDGHTGYNPVTTPEGRMRGGCWSHARRKLYEARAYAPEMVDAVLLLIHEMFVVEQSAIEEGIVGTRRHLRLRQRRSAPLMRAVMKKLDETVGAFSPESTLAKASRYVLNQRDALALYLTDARVHMHNNASESALRIVALLRKNALFVGHDQGGHHLAILLSMCATCRLHGVNPDAWFADVLIRISERGSTVEELLPWVWKEGRGVVPSDTS